MVIVLDSKNFSLAVHIAMHGFITCDCKPQVFRWSPRRAVLTVCKWRVHLYFITGVSYLHFYAVLAQAKRLFMGKKSCRLKIWQGVVQVCSISMHLTKFPRSKWSLRRPGVAQITSTPLWRALSCSNNRRSITFHVQAGEHITHFLKLQEACIAAAKYSAFWHSCFTLWFCLICKNFFYSWRLQYRQAPGESTTRYQESQGSLAVVSDWTFTSESVNFRASYSLVITA